MVNFVTGIFLEAADSLEKSCLIENFFDLRIEIKTIITKSQIKS